MIANRLRELREAQEVLDLLADKRRAAQLSGEAAGVFEVVHGRQALRHHVLHLLHTARSEVINMVKPHFRISVRTVQRKVHALMEMAGVRTRMQLAWEASRQDWLPGPTAGPSAVPRPRSPGADARPLRVVDGAWPPVQRR
jgi:hypothetical protein